MKKRIRSQPTNPFYSNEPAVAKGLMADRPPVQSASLGSKPSKITPQKPGRMSGLAGFVDKHKPKQQGIKPKPPTFGQKSKSPKQTPIKASKPKPFSGGIKSFKRM